MRIVYAVSITSGVLPFAANIPGTVSRFIGDGVGLARLVELSIVKVDMADGLTLEAAAVKYVAIQHRHSSPSTACKAGEGLV
jgi:hypothetical protein